MADKSVYQSNMDQAVGIKDKFDFFMVGLTFSILALAVKTTIDIDVIAPRVMELLGWVSLLIAGLVGLSHIAWKPVLLENSANMSVLEEGVKGVGNEKQRFDALQEGNEKLKKQECSLDFKNSARNISFLLGIVLLMVSRGWEHFQFVMQ